MKIIIIVLLALFLGGCVTIKNHSKSYHSPQSGEWVKHHYAKPAAKYHKKHKR